MINENLEVPILKKRGRKPKNQNNLNKPFLIGNFVKNINEEFTNEIINEEITNIYNKVIEKNFVEKDLNLENEEFNYENENENENDENLRKEKTENKNDEKVHISKKRGRKPKGGKIIQQPINLNQSKDIKQNVILHLKCFLKDLSNNTYNQLQGFDFNNNLNYSLLNTNINKEATQNEQYNSQTNINQYISDNLYDLENEEKNSKNNVKEIYKKLKQLERNLHINQTCNTKSDCFWCTCSFDNPAVYIPKYLLNGFYKVYGCFCSPECAVGYLMNENIDDSVRFERYHLINNIYTKIYNYNINIKPAPSPYYMLDKYYGNLTIQQYRSLFNNGSLFLFVDKPLTKILPELHEDNDDFIINNKIIPSNTNQIKKIREQKN